MNSIRNHPDWKLAEAVSLEEMARIEALARRVEETSADGAGVETDVGGIHLFGMEARPSFLARLTASGGNGTYSWKAVQWRVIEDLPPDYVPLDSGLSGTFGGTGAGLARETNYNATIIADPDLGDIVRLTLADDGTFWEFERSQSDEGLPGSVSELWANCTLSNLGTVLVLQDQEGISAVILLAADTYRFVFDVTFVDAEHFQWSGNCIGASLEEVMRTADSVTVKTNNATAAPRFGIDVRGHLGAGGSGSGSGSGASSGSGGDVDYGPGGGVDCDNAVELTLGVEYGPFTIAPGSGVDWFSFPTLAATPDYHVTLTWVNGSDVSVFVFRGDCADLNNWFTTGVNEASPVGCADNASPAFDGFGLMYVTAAFGGSYTILVDETPC